MSVVTFIELWLHAGYLPCAYILTLPWLSSEVCVIAVSTHGRKRENLVINLLSLFILESCVRARVLKPQNTAFLYVCLVKGGKNKV